MSVPVYEQLYSISDLHLGGDPAVQIFNQSERLANTINKITEDANKKTAFVLNGDIVDFLAEQTDLPAKHLDPINAIKKLERIINDTQFNKVWLALQNFVSKENCHLVLVLGNHDVELALPDVQEWLCEYLAQDKSANRGRIQFCYDGIGFACKVGSRRILCLHGNEVDDWNVVDYFALMQMGRAINRTQPLPEWDANAGTRLVIGVMNQVKKKFPMVDLLKPEIEGVIPTILALKPDLDGFKTTARIARVMQTLGKDKIRRRMNFLDAEDSLTHRATEAEQFNSPYLVLEEIMNEFEALSQITSTETSYSNQLLQTAYRQAKDDSYKYQPASHQNNEMLGFSDWKEKWENFISQYSSTNILRQTLKYLLADSPAFDLDHKDKDFIKLNESVGSEVDFLIAGHTHLRRAIPRNRGFYYNSGTWIRLIRLTREVLDKEKKFEKVYNVFKAGTLQALDDHKIPGPEGTQNLVLIQPTVVHIKLQDVTVTGQLCEATTDGTLQPVASSQFSLPNSSIY